MPEAPRPLARRMGLFGVLFLTLSAATPASSLFVIVPDVVREAAAGGAPRAPLPQPPRADPAWACSSPT